MRFRRITRDNYDAQSRCEPIYRTALQIDELKLKKVKTRLRIIKVKYKLKLMQSERQAFEKLTDI